jgi:hypothetical protein
MGNGTALCVTTRAHPRLYRLPECQKKAPAALADGKTVRPTVLLCGQFDYSQQIG